MNYETVKTALPIAASLLLMACSDINSSWEVDGGGYIKYKINGEGPYTINLSKNDAEPPFYVNNSHSYFYFQTSLRESKRGDQISLLVQSPVVGKKMPPVSRANVNGHMEPVTWMRVNNSTEATLINDSAHASYIHFDEIIKDSLYTADLNLYFTDCRLEDSCNESLPPIHVTGRLRYWIPMDERD